MFFLFEVEGALLPLSFVLETLWVLCVDGPLGGVLGGPVDFERAASELFDLP